MIVIHREETLLIPLLFVQIVGDLSLCLVAGNLLILTRPLRIEIVHNGLWNLQSLSEIDMALLEIGCEL